MEVKKCRYCAGLPDQYTHEGRNRIGEIGFVSVLKCRGCYRRVETFGSTPDRAEEKCLQYWNWGAYDN